MHYYETDFKAKDIQFIIEITKIIRENRIKCVILDEYQASRFSIFLAKIFQDLRIIIIMNEDKNTTLNILKFRTSLTYYIENKFLLITELVRFNKDIFKLFKKIKNVCIIQDFCSGILHFEKEFNSIKINS